MAPEYLIVLAIFLSFIVLEILLTGFFNKPKQKWSDAVVELVSTGTLSTLIQPLVMAGGLTLGALLFSEHRYSLGSNHELMYNTDGSLDFYLSNKRPTDESHNWVPASTPRSLQGIVKNLLAR